MEALPLAFTTGWASGINAYACILIFGMLGRYARVDEVPHAFTCSGVLIIAAVLLVAGLGSVYFAIRAIRRGLARFRAWRDRRRFPVTGRSVA
jgi:hypothetical protein